MNIGSKIKQLRQELNLTQDELAQAAGTTKQTIHKYETGIIANIPASKIKLIADKLGTTPAYLMGWESSAEATKNDIITDIILRLRTDDNLLSLIEDLIKLSEEQLTAVKVFLAAFK